MPDWLGTEFLPFAEAREIVRKLGIPNNDMWYQYCKSGKKPHNIPNYPDDVYEGKGWISFGDWLGTGYISTQKRQYLPFAEAREYIRKQKIPTQEAWQQYCKSGKKPHNIPTRPDRIYRNNGWISTLDWLGTQKIEYLPFAEAREYVHKLGIPTQKGWQQYCKSGKKPHNIPAHPGEIYEGKGWISFGDWLGTSNIATRQIGWTIDKVKELVRDLIKNKVIDKWSEDERYHLLLAKGVLNLQSNRFSKLLQDLVIGPKTEEQRKALEDFANSDNDDDADENIPDIGREEIPTLSTEKLAELVEEEGHTDPLEEEKIQTPQQIFSQSEYLESYCQDIELMQFFVSHFVYKLWKSVFSEQDTEERKESTVNTARSQGRTGKKFHDTIVETFLSEYDGMESLQIPKGYAFQDGPPRIMQKYAAYRIKRDPYFCNLSGTGAGKTLSASKPCHR